MNSRTYTINTSGGDGSGGGKSGGTGHGG